MALRTVVTFPEPILKQRCAEVTDFGPELHTLLDDMAETMAKEEGIGLGLAVAKQAAEAHGATLGWSRRDGWTVFRVAWGRIPWGLKVTKAPADARSRPSSDGRVASTRRPGPRFNGRLGSTTRPSLPSGFGDGFGP